MIIEKELVIKLVNYLANKPLGETLELFNSLQRLLIDEAKKESMNEGPKEPKK